MDLFLALDKKSHHECLVSIDYLTTETCPSFPYPFALVVDEETITREIEDSHAEEVKYATQVLPKIINRMYLQCIIERRREGSVGFTLKWVTVCIHLFFLDFHLFLGFSLFNRFHFLASRFPLKNLQDRLSWNFLVCPFVSWVSCLLCRYLPFF